MVNSYYTVFLKNVVIVVTTALAASLSVVDASSSYKCTFEDAASLHGSKRFTIRTRHRNRIMKGKKEGHFAAISGQKVVLIVIRVSDMQFCNDSSTLCFVNAVAMGFHREMEEPSRSTSRFSADKGRTALFSRKKFLPGNSNGGVGHHGDDVHGRHFSLPNVTKRF